MTQRYLQACLTNAMRQCRSISRQMAHKKGPQQQQEQYLSPHTCMLSMTHLHSHQLQLSKQLQLVAAACSRAATPETALDSASARGTAMQTLVPAPDSSMQAKLQMSCSGDTIKVKVVDTHASAAQTLRTHRSRAQTQRRSAILCYLTSQ